MSKKITFCIATFQNPESAKETLESLSQTVDQSNYDVITVDDAGNMPEEPFKEFIS